MEREWKVCFENGFWGREGGTPCTEIPMSAGFRWADRDWIIPAAYICEKGIVLDFCMRAEADALRLFLDKWQNAAEERLSREQRIQMEAENPLRFEFNVAIIVNGKRYIRSGSSSMAYIPAEIYEEENGAGEILEHYGLDASCGWNFRRVRFPWKDAPQGEIHALSIEMEQSPVEIPGPKFQVSAVGQEFEFVHPSAGTKHVLTVQNLETMEIPAGHIPEPDLDFPRKCLGMEYTIEPNLPEGSFFLRDCAPSDPPRDRDGKPAPRLGGAIGLIGRSRSGENRVVFSSMHFEAVESAQWQICFRETHFQTSVYDLFPET